MYFILVDDEESLLTGTAGCNVAELISFASFDIPNEPNPQHQTTTDVSNCQFKSSIGLFLYSSHYLLTIYSIRLISTVHRHRVYLNIIHQRQVRRFMSIHLVCHQHQFEKVILH